MASTPVPLAVPDDLLGELKTAEKITGLPRADVMRQAMKLGLPSLCATYQTSGRITNVEPLSSTDLDRIYSEREDDEAGIRRLIAAQPQGAE